MKIPGNCFNIDSYFELDSMEARFFYEEPCIYFCGKGQCRLAFVFSSAKKTISTIKKLGKVLKIKYNIKSEIRTVLLNEKNDPENIEENISTKGKTEMSNNTNENQDNVRMSSFGHRLSSQSGFIDKSLGEGKEIPEIVILWNKSNEKKINDKRVEAHIRHLTTEHNYKAQGETTEEPETQPEENNAVQVEAEAQTEEREEVEVTE